MSRVIAIDSSAISARPIAEAADVLRRGGLVAFPTETVYGLGARALDERAIARIFAAKGRPVSHPLIAHVATAERAERLARSWPALAATLSRAFWPGPLTLVVDRASHVTPALSGGQDSIAVRVPTHPVALSLLAALDEPIAAPSANRYQGLSPTTAAHVVKELGSTVDLVLDGGPCTAGIESTVVDVRGGVARVLRPGALGLAELREVVGAVEDGRVTAQAGAPRASPGMDPKHYAPKAPLFVVDSLDATLSFARELAARGHRGHERVGLVLWEPSSAEQPARSDPGLVLRALGDDPSLYAHRLYAALHELDEVGVSAIVVQRVPSGDAWWAVADRLDRASCR